MAEAICYIHDSCKELVQGVIENLDPEQNHSEIVILSKVLAELDLAKERGQSMEDRLVEYREAIESLGFIRIRQEEPEKSCLNCLNEDRCPWPPEWPKVRVCDGWRPEPMNSYKGGRRRYGRYKE